jgi:dethiobiotin synthetase
MTAYFVTSTGTDIGKTYVTAGLVRALRAQGGAVSALKPVASGYSPETAAASDAGALLAALGEDAIPDAVARISPWRYAAALSPDMAAAREGQTLDYGALVDFCRARIAGAQGTLFIEGVGGVMVPLDGAHTVRDWMAALGLPVILVAGSYLGTISHTLTALDVLARARLRVAGVVVNESAECGVPIHETLATLRRFAGAVPLLALARGAEEREFANLWEKLAAKAQP